MNAEELCQALDQIVDAIQKDFDDRIAVYPVDLYDSTLSEVVAGLISRQAVLAIQLLMSPNMWNGHVAPLIHRVMADVHITLAYILQAEPEKRAKDFVLFGLGQEKLMIAHYEARLAEDDIPAMRTMVAARKRWLESQRREFLTEVNLGSATGLSTRDMADRSGNSGLYKYNFTPFSAAVHSTWQHVGRYNLQMCKEPLHGYHLIGVIAEPDNDSYEPWLAVKNLSETFELVDKFYSIDTLSVTSWDAINNLLVDTPDGENT